MLTSKQVDHYWEQGHCVSPGFLSATVVAELLTDVGTICAKVTVSNHDSTRMEMEPDQPSEGNRVRRLYEPCTHYSRFRGLSESPRLLDSVAQLLGPDLTFHYSKLNMKPPSIGSVVEWHQDLAYYPLTNRDSLAVLFYLDDADLHNGCLQVIPGRHQGPVMDHSLNGIFQGRITEPVDDSAVVPVEGKAGTAIFMNGMVPHASAQNTSPNSRRTLILSYRAADAFPIFVGEMTRDSEAYVRHARGEPSSTARLAEGSLPIPRYPRATKSLYELQELSRQGKV
jgi:phytanoyl-CoA hydroxylase